MPNPTDDQLLLDALALITHLQASGEAHKAALARMIHDEVAGLMTAALMDVTSAAGTAAVLDERAQARLYRAQQTLLTAIDRSREMIEELRPSLLDNFGLFAALKWHVQEARRNSRVIFSERYPEVEPQIGAAASIALYRIAEDALEMTYKRGQVTIASLGLSVERGMLTLEFSDNGVAPDGRERHASLMLAAMRHRMEVLGGTILLERDGTGITRLTARLPVDPGSRRS
jgi:signal transduction histidine kinase